MCAESLINVSLPFVFLEYHIPRYENYVVP